MLAETAFNVIEALSPEEKQRLFKMLQVEPISNKSKVKKKKNIISDSQIREMIVSKFRKRFKNHRL